MDNTILKRIFLFFGIAFFIFVVLILLYRSSFQKLNENTRLLIHHLEILDNTEQLLGLITDMEASTRGFALTNEDRFLNPYFISKQQYPEKLKELKTLIGQNLKQRVYLDTLSELISRKVMSMEFIIHLKKSDNFNFGYLEILDESSQLMDSIKIVSAKMKMEEQRWKIYRNLEGSDSIMNTKILSTIFSITAAIILLISLAYILFEIRSKQKVKDVLDAVLQASQSAILSFAAMRQPDGRINDFQCIQYNRIGAAMASSQNEKLIGKTMSEIFPDSLPSGLMEEYIKVVLESKVYKTERFYTHEQKAKWYRIVAVKLEDGITVTYDDITKEKEYEVTLEKYIVELKRSNSELEQFAFVASHDLQEPLRKIQAFGDRLNIKARHLFTDETKVYMDKMLSSSMRMSGLITDLLNFSRLTRSKDQFAVTDLNKIFHEVMSDLELAINKKNALIVFDNFPHAEAVESQMYQLFFNLLSNALKFSKPVEQPVIKVKCEVYSRPVASKIALLPSNQKQYMKLIFSDNGIGFNQQYVDKIFVIFQRLHGKHTYEGTGIGLAICKRIVSIHSGTITAHGTLGKGADFIVELPLLQHK